MSKGKKKPPPSRGRYDGNRPTFSFRIYDELKARVEEVKKAEGISNTNIVEVAVGLLEVKVRKEKEIRDQAYSEGYDDGLEKGFEFAESLFKVIYRCSGCGEPIELDTTEEKEAAAQYMVEHGWCHAECHEKKHRR